LLKLVRYIHLNPLRAGITKDMNELSSYRYSGHTVLMGRLSHYWQNRDYVLGYFGNKTGPARSNYQSFIAEGIKQGHRPELVGGGLIRSAGGWTVLKENRREGIRLKGDERILGSSNFVMEVLKKSEEEFEKSTLLKKQGVDFEGLVARVAQYYGINKAKLIRGSRERSVVKAREVLCCLAVRKLKMSCLAVSKKLNIGPSAVSRSISRGEIILTNAKIEEKLLISK